MDSKEREDLDALIASDGWRVFTAYVAGEWGSGGRRFEHAVQQCADNPNDADATAKLRQVMVAKREIETLLKWPHERLKALQSPELVAASPLDYGRRGHL